MSRKRRDQRRWRLFQSLRPLSRARALRDALAGFQLAAMNLPQALGYTKIAGTPIVTGFYTLLLPPVAFAAFGSSRFLVVAADSATAAILSGGLVALAPLGSARYVELASLVALLTAAILLLARLLKLGFLADFLSQTVLVGFLTGVGFQVGIAVLGEMLGLEVTSHRTVLQLVEISRNLSRVHLPTVTVSFVVVAGVLSLGWVAPKGPWTLIAVVAAIVASKMWNFAGHGIDLIGAVATGLPHLGPPQIHLQDLESSIGIAGACFVMIITQSAATARFYAMRHEQALDENADLAGLCAANAAAAFSGTFTVNGSPTQTAMMESSGGRSQFAQLTMAALVALVLLFLTRPMQYLPRCVLGAIVFIIAIKLVNLRGLASIRRESPGEFALAVITAIVVVGVGVEQGIVLAMVLSLLRIVGHSYRPHTGVLVAEGELYWRLIPAEAGALTKPGLVIYRFGAPLFYANVGNFVDEVRAVVGSAPSPPGAHNVHPRQEASAVRWLVVDAEAITDLDYTAARIVRQLQRELAQESIVLAFARVPPYLKADFDRHHLTEAVGAEMIFSRLHDALEAFAKFAEETARPGTQQ